MLILQSNYSIIIVVFLKIINDHLSQAPPPAAPHESLDEMPSPEHCISSEKVFRKRCNIPHYAAAAADSVPAKHGERVSQLQRNPFDSAPRHGRR